MISTQMNITGITCGKCVAAIEKVLGSSHLNLNNIKVHKDSGVVSFRSQEAVNPRAINLIFEENKLSKYSVTDFSKSNQFLSIASKLYPLFLIFSYLLLTVFAISFISKDFSMGTLMSHYMGGFFIVFSFFKFLNLTGFVDAFQTYDPIAKVLRGYGYFYAIFELLAGIFYLVAPTSLLLNVLVVSLLSITSVGVWKAVASKKTIQCACLGTVFNLPMTYVTIFENAIMILMATFIIILNV